MTVWLPHSQRTEGDDRRKLQTYPEFRLVLNEVQFEDSWCRCDSQSYSICTYCISIQLHCQLFHFSCPFSNSRFADLSAKRRGAFRCGRAFEDLQGDQKPVQISTENQQYMCECIHATLSAILPVSAPPPPVGRGSAAPGR